ncbi:hypothetical protein SAMN04489859_11044, partial [Paracoccus alcaliphilus]
ADWLRDDLKGRSIRPCIPPRKKRRKPARYNKGLPSASPIPSDTVVTADIFGYGDKMSGPASKGV